MLIGQYQSKLTDKERIVVPAKFREELGKSVVICRWYEKSLSIFSLEAWRKILDLALGESLLTVPSRDTERFLLAGAFEIDLDGQGRLVLPKLLKEHASLEKEIVFIGLRDRIEVWDQKLWKEREEKIVSQAEDLIRQVQETKLSSIKIRS